MPWKILLGPCPGLGLSLAWCKLSQLTGGDEGESFQPVGLAYTVFTYSAYTAYTAYVHPTS